MPLYEYACTTCKNTCVWHLQWHEQNNWTKFKDDVYFKIHTFEISNALIDDQINRFPLQHKNYLYEGDYVEVVEDYEMASELSKQQQNTIAKLQEKIRFPFL